MSKKLLSINDLSEYLGIEVRTLYNMIRDSRFPVKPIIDKPKYWNIEDVDAWRLGDREVSN